MATVSTSAHWSLLPSPHLPAAAHWVTMFTVLDSEVKRRIRIALAKAAEKRKDPVP